MAQMKKMQNVFSWVVIASEFSHVFCCVLPSLFSVFSLLVGMGVIGVMPLWMKGFHDAMHAYEIPLMAMSGLVVLLGWGLHALSRRMDCHDSGCGHGACTPKKNRSEIILKFATVLFLINVMVYLVVHRGMEHMLHGYSAEISAQGHEHDDHHD